MTTYRTEQEEDLAAVDAGYQEKYEMALRRSAQDGMMAVTMASLTLRPSGGMSRRVKAQREEIQVQMEAIQGTVGKGLFASRGQGYLGRAMSDDHSDTVEQIRENKHRSDHGEYTPHVNGFSNHLVEAHGLHLSKINSAVAKRVSELVSRDLYCEPPEPTLLERIGI